MFPTIESFDERLPTKTEVIGISHAGSHRAYPVADLISTGLVNDEVGGLPIVLVGDPSGAVNVFRRDVDGRVHEFAPSAGGFSDESGHVYDLRGRSPQGSDLDPYPHASRVLWLIWSNFHPETDLAAV